jgi:5-methylcytosine-specific restriction endonuclease McrA
MALKPCIVCGVLTNAGSYCVRHNRRWPDNPSRPRGRAWQQLRASLIASWGGRCSECGSGGVPLQLHHVDGNVQNADPANLRPVCVGCHRRAEHRRRQT